MQTFRKRAYTVEALVEAGIPASVARTLTADGPLAVPERPLTSLHSRRRVKMPTTIYCWGPDVNALLRDHINAGHEWALRFWRREASK